MHTHLLYIQCTCTCVIIPNNIPTHPCTPHHHTHTHTQSHTCSCKSINFVHTEKTLVQSLLSSPGLCLILHCRLPTASISYTLTLLYLKVYTLLFACSPNPFCALHRKGKWSLLVQDGIDLGTVIFNGQKVLQSYNVEVMSSSPQWCIICIQVYIQIYCINTHTQTHTHTHKSQCTHHC